jgi:hypothetical protein
MFLPYAPRQRVDRAARQVWQALGSLRHRRRGGVPRPVRLTGKQQQQAANKARLDEAQVQREAEAEAQDVIDRVRRQARSGKPIERDGNVYRPDAFKPRPPEDKLH